jgi:hypothetical protein
VVVVPDSGGHGQQALDDAGHDTAWSVPAVCLEIELALQGVVDRLDDLAERLEETCPGAWCLAGLGRTEQGDATLDEEGLELGRGVAFVGQDHLSFSEEAGLQLKEVPGDFALVGLGVGQGEGDGQARGRTDQMESQSPKVTARRETTSAGAFGRGAGNGLLK